MSTDIKDVVIIGGGPAGLTAAIYAARAGLKPVVVTGDYSPNYQPGGQLMITTEVENYPGFPKGIDGPKLISELTEQAVRFGAELVSGVARNFDLPNGGPFTFSIEDTIYTTKSLICANGARANWLNLPNENRYKNNGVSACATCDGPLPIFRNKHIYVIGGGDSAIEEAMFLTKFASEVTIIHRRDELRASKIMQDRAFNNPKISFLWNTTIVGYLGEKQLEGLALKRTDSDKGFTVDTVGLFVAIGHSPNTETLVGSGLNLDERGYIVVNNGVHTNIDGVFACGDVHDTVYRQAITASGFGCMAAISAERWLDNH